MLTILTEQCQSANFGATKLRWKSEFGIVPTKAFVSRRSLPMLFHAAYCIGIVPLIVLLLMPKVLKSVSKEYSKGNVPARLLALTSNNVILLQFPYDDGNAPLKKLS